MILFKIRTQTSVCMLLWGSDQIIADMDEKSSKLHIPVL
jgi:hypothetical protein